MLKKFTTLIILAVMGCLSSQAQEPQVRELYSKGIEESKKGNLDAAIQFYTEAIKLDNGYGNAYTGRGLAYLRKRGTNSVERQRNFELAIGDLSTAIDLNPNLVASYINRSSAYSAKNDFEKALADLQKAEEIDPKFPHIYSARGNIYTKTKEYQLAVTNFSKAIEIKPQSDFYRGRCNAFYDFGKYEEAVADCSEAIKLNPQAGWAFYFRGLSRVKLEQNALAISDFRKTLDFEPKHIGAKQQLDNLLKTNKY